MSATRIFCVNKRAINKWEVFNIDIIFWLRISGVVSLVPFI